MAAAGTCWRAVLTRPLTVGVTVTQDDLRLQEAVQRFCDLETVAKRTRFSHKFTVDEISARWHALLFDASISAQVCVSRCPLPRPAPPAGATDVIASMGSLQSAWRLMWLQQNA